MALCSKERSWTAAQWLHLLGAAVYSVDLLRMHSHPHCWIVNVPFVAWWAADRMYGVFWYRRCIANVVGKVHLDAEYVILFLRIPEALHALHAVGDVFYLNVLDCGADRAHPFTVFQNHRKQRMLTEKKELLPSWTGHKYRIYAKACSFL